MSVSRAPDRDDDAPPHILVVDDEILVRTVIATVLRDLGAVVVEAADADEAWRYIASGLPIDLVFTDHRMPGSMSGAELAARVRKEHPRIDVVLVSGDWLGADGTEPVLPKPYPIDQTAAQLALRALRARRRDSGVE